jgi:hypothetical protein
MVPLLVYHFNGKYMSTTKVAFKNDVMKLGEGKGGGLSIFVTLGMTLTVKQAFFGRVSIKSHLRIFH